eukprot:1432205-Amphidinium_carterae.1
MQSNMRCRRIIREEGWKLSQNITASPISTLALIEKRVKVLEAAQREAAIVVKQSLCIQVKRQSTKSEPIAARLAGKDGSRVGRHWHWASRQPQSALISIECHT